MKTHPCRGALLTAALPGVLAGCASLSSEPVSPDGGDGKEGLVYHLPRRDIVVTVIVDANGAATDIAIDAGAAYADPAQAYLLRLNRSAIGNSKVDIGISADGLLTKADASTTPRLLEALQFVAEEAAKLKSQRAPANAGANPCANAGSHRFRLPLLSHREEKNPPAELKPYQFAGQAFSTTVCGGTLAVTVRELAPLAPVAAAQSAQPPDPGAAARTGVYYRQSRPFLVTVAPMDGFGFHAVQVVASPTRSPTRFLPYERTAFAQSTVTLGFSDGQPNAFVEDVEGEIPALLKLPAALLRAYFSAIGAVFDGFSKRDSAEAGALNNALQLELAKQKTSACLAAIKSDPKNKTLLDDLGCSAKP